MINTASNSVVTNIPVPVDVTLADINDNTVLVMSTATNTVVAAVPVGNFPQGVAFGTLQPEEPEPTLIARVEARITAGTLTQDQGDGLVDKIQEAKTARSRRLRANR